MFYQFWVDYNDLSAIVVNEGHHPQIALIQVSEILDFAQINYMDHYKSPISMVRLNRFKLLINQMEMEIYVYPRHGRNSSRCHRDCTFKLGK